MDSRVGMSAEVPRYPVLLCHYLCSKSCHLETYFRSLIEDVLPPVKLSSFLQILPFILFCLFNIVINCPMSLLKAACVLAVMVIERVRKDNLYLVKGKQLKLLGHLLVIERWLALVQIVTHPIPNG